MKDNMNNEEARLDEFMDNISKASVPVPEDLEDRIVQRINRLKPKKHYSRNIAAAIIAIFMLFVAGVKFNPVFASYAASIPGLKTAVEWLTGDKGIANARNKGYKGMQDITIVEDDYTLLLQNIIMDEDRIYLSAAATGGEITDMLNKRANTEPVEANIAEDSKPDLETLHLRVKFVDFEDSGASSEYGSQETFAAKVEKTFKSGELQSFLSKSPDSLKLEVSIYKGKESVHDFKPISIPLDESSFMASKVYTPNEKRSYEHTGIILNELTVSPTRMRLDIHFNMDKDYIFTGFENPRLEDDKGNVYKPEGLISKHNNPSDRSIYFVPSIYFDKPPKHLYFRFDGLRIASEEGKQFKLALDDIYPKELNYMGQTITIKEISWAERSGLTIISTVPDEKILKIQGIREVDYHGSTGWSSHDNKVYSYLYDIEKKDVYELEFEYPGYLIPTEAPWEIPLDH
jgi:hypothetical protein